jgi:predicted nucleic acid-binding protein
VKTLYFDTNYLFRLYSTEPGAAAVQELADQAESIAIAWHGRAELASILLRKRREGALSEDAANVIGSQIQDDVAQGLVAFLPLTEAVMSRLETVLAEAPATTNIRAADALHLACAADHGFDTVYSNDRLVLAGAPGFGLKGVNVIASPAKPQFPTEKQ